MKEYIDKVESNMMRKQDAAVSRVGVDHSFHIYICGIEMANASLRTMESQLNRAINIKSLRRVDILCPRPECLGRCYIVLT